MTGPIASSNGNLMIYCPDCGTSNREGSRFCSECGESLPSTGLRCPMCGTLNPVSNVYCEECTARLVPMTATSEGESEEDKAQPIKGVSLPTIPLAEAEPGSEVQPETEESSSEDWLNELRESADEVDAGAEDHEEGKQVEQSEDDLEPADIPDWLTELGSGGEETQVSRSLEGFSSDEAVEEVTESTGISEQQRVPGVSGGMTPEEEHPRASDEDSLEPADIPDWLSDLRSEQRETVSHAGEKASEVEGRGEENQRAERSREQEEALLAEEPKLEELPEWLRDTVGSAAEVEQRPQRDETESISKEPSDQLEEALTAEEELLSGKQRSGEGEAEGASSPEPIGTPEWLRDADGDQEGALPEESGVAFTETPPETFEPPDWLRGLMEEQVPSPEEEPSPFAAGATFASEESGRSPKPADIPYWLRELRPSEAKQEETPEAPPETEGLLKGLRDLIPASPGIEAPPSYQGQSTVGTTEASRARAELLQSLLGQPHARPRPELEKKESDIGRRVERWTVTVVLLVSVMGMLLAPLLTNEAPRLTQPVAASEVRQLYELVNGLDATDTVLVAFDYGPPEADELNGVAQPVLEHLIDSGGRLSIVSTRPDAPPVAAALMSEVADSSDEYMLLGYRPGAGSAVSHLLAAVNEPPALLLILTSRPGPLLRWIEQAQARYGDQIQVATASSALLEPVTSPYLDTSAGQLKAAVHGLRGAAAYEALRGEQGEATRKLDTLAAGHVAVVALMIVGAAIYGISGSRRGEG